MNQVASAPSPPIRVAKLIMVTAHNNNKFYEMKDNGDGTFTALYGRVGARGTSRSYPIRSWEQKYREKIGKGYKDQTHLFADRKEVSLWDGLEDPGVSRLMQALDRYANQAISHHYLVSADQVTRRQVEEAQGILDILAGMANGRMKLDTFNQLLLDLYQIIPRRMGNVGDHLIVRRMKRDLIREMLAGEQDTLDVMRAQVDTHRSREEMTPAQSHGNMLEALGLDISILEDSKEIRRIKKMMGKDSGRFARAFRVVNTKTQQSFDQFVGASRNQKVKMFWHGSRNENWMSILKTGLVLRPATAVITGKMFGYGLYFADKCRKSLNYSSVKGAYWSGGSSHQGFLALYDVHVGRQLKVLYHRPWCSELTEEKLKKRGSRYDSLFARGGVDLINNEYIVYNESQATIRYLVEVTS